MRVRWISCFNICDVIVVKSSYITFLIHKEQFAFHVHTLRITKKLSFCRTLGRCMSYSLVTSVFCVLRQKAVS